MTISGRSADALEDAATELDVETVVADAADPSQAPLPVERALEAHGRVDIVVSNVGGTVRGNQDLFDGVDEVFAGTIALNLTSAFLVCRAALGAMRDQQYGRLVTIGSGASHRAVATPGYTAAKHGLVGLTKQLAQDLGTYGITANCVFPGWTNTDLVDFDRIAARQGITADEARANAEAVAAQQRIIEPEEIGPLVAFLASPAAGAITGQTIGADGGFRL